MRLLQGPPPPGLGHRLLDRIGLLVGVEDDLAGDVAGGAADGLDERSRRAQEALLVGVEDRDQRDLGDVEALAQEVDADQDVELAPPQVADDLDALEGVDVGVEVADPDPDLGYNQLIRPWKSRLGLFYIDHSAILLDLKLVGLTALAILSRKRALGAVAADLQARGAPAELVEIAGRRSRLVPHPPPGATEVVQSRDAVAA